jgi:dipeptidyl aminopeptidase/acylaminoacyl peptidase
MKTVASLALAGALLIVGCGPSLMRPAPLIPREILVGNPERASPQISPDGKFISYLAPDKNNVLQIWLRTLGNHDGRQLTEQKIRGIENYTWTYDNEHLIFAQDSDGDENWHLHAVNIQSGIVRNLTPFKGVQSRVVALDPNFPQAMLIAMNLRNRRFHDVYRINLSTGEPRLVGRNPGRQVWWLADSRLQVRIATTTGAVSGRDAPGSRWKPLYQWQGGETGGVIGLSQDEKTVHIRATHEGDTASLLAIDYDSGKKTVVAADPAYDLAGVFMHPVTRNIQAVSFNKDRLEWRVLDPSIAEDFAALAKVRKGEFNVVHRSYSPVLPSLGAGRRDLQDKTWIVSYASDDGPLHYYTYDRPSKTATFLFSTNPKLDRAALANMQPISYTSRDGLTLHGYLTLPVGVAAKNLPTVLLVHGGPWSRDSWGYHPVVQWLANRGYAVLQVNYRGSTGYGRQFVLSSYREWAGKMHDDLIDGVDWIVKQQIADPKKIAIMGFSFGGYATMVGLTFTPDVFIAGVAVVGISNLVSWFENIPPYWAPYRGMFIRRVGDPQKEEEFLKSRSPVFFVDRLKAPLLIAHGANDVRVVATQSYEMVEAMRKNNKPLEYVVTYEDEGHRFARPENRYHFYAKAEEFLAKHLGGRFEPEAGFTGRAGVVQ